MTVRDRRSTGSAAKWEDCRESFNLYSGVGLPRRGDTLGSAWEVGS